MTKHLTRRKLGRAAAIALAVLIATWTAVATPGAAHANNWAGPSGETGCSGITQADNKTHTMYYDPPMTTPVLQAHNWANANPLNGPAGVHVVVKGTLSAKTDAVEIDANYDSYCGLDWHTSSKNGGTIGQSRCMGPIIDGGDCQKHEDRYDTSWTTSATTTQLRRLITHEVGHSLGLKHRGGGDVMDTPITDVTSSYFSAHDIAHLDFLDE